MLTRPAWFSRNKTRRVRKHRRWKCDLAKLVFVTFCSVVKPDFYFPSLYFRNLQIKLAMYFLICMHVWRKLETDMCPGKIKTSKYSIKVKETKKLRTKIAKHAMSLASNFGWERGGSICTLTDLRIIPETTEKIRFHFTTCLFCYIFQFKFTNQTETVWLVTEMITNIFIS